MELSLTQEQKDELEKLRLEMVSIRKQLRDVQRGFARTWRTSKHGFNS